MALQGKTDQYQIVVQLGLKENLGKYFMLYVWLFLQELYLVSTYSYLSAQLHNVNPL